MSKHILFPAILDSIKTRKDKTLSVNLATQELSPTVASELMRLHQGIVYVMLKEDAVTKVDEELIDKLDIEFDKPGKTQSQRIRSVLFVAWKQDQDGFDSFVDYYSAKTNKFIESIKATLDPSHA